MEVAIKKINGVKSVSIVFLTQRMTLEADDSAMRRIEQEVEKAIKKIESDVKMKRISK
jgi:copper chaperone CopZ